MAKLKLTLACWDYDRTRALIEGRVRLAGIDLDIEVLRPRQASWAARSIYQAFLAAKDLAVAGLYDSDALQLSLPWLLDHVEEARRAFSEDSGRMGSRPTGPPWRPWDTSSMSRGSRRGRCLPTSFSPLMWSEWRRQARPNGLLKKGEPLRP
jgi:hypothetical protein